MLAYLFPADGQWFAGATHEDAGSLLTAGAVIRATRAAAVPSPHLCSI